MKSIENIIKHILRLLSSTGKSRFLNKPVFVVACGRSGSTAMCQALGEHPQILMATPEAPLIHRLGELAYDYAFSKSSRFLQGTVQIPEENFRTNLKNQCYTSVFGLNFGLNYNPFKIGMKNSVFRSNKQLKYWGAKVFPPKESFEGLLWLYPDAKFIYLFRNGLDVVHSMSKFKDFTKLDFSERCRFWSERVSQYQYLKSNKNVLCVRFEEFLTDRSSVFERIFTHLEIDYAPGPLNFASSTLVHSLDKTTSRANPTEELLKRRKEYMDWNTEKKTIFKDICTDAMIALKYETPF